VRRRLKAHCQAKIGAHAVAVKAAAVTDQTGEAQGSREGANARLREQLVAFPGGKGFGEGAFAGRTLLHRQDGAAAISVDDRDVEPRTFLE
jgi:hypothetical protein